MSQFLLGSDPELFVYSTTTGTPVAICGKLGGTKENPTPVHELGKGYAYQEDNVLAEFNIPPAKNKTDFTNSIDKMLDFLTTKLSGIGLTPAWTASEIMPKEEMTNPAAWVFGCEPDYNVWELEINPRPSAPDPLLRSAGGHIHVGASLNKTKKILLARWMDASLGLWSVIVDPDTRRRQLYGKAGSIRFKPYGIEYRTLSNFWVRSRKTQVYELTQWAIKRANENSIESSYINRFGPQIQHAINNSDVAAAKALQRQVLPGALISYE